MLGSQGGENAIKQFFYEKTRELMQGESCRSVGTSVHTVDIVRDVLKIVPLHWACGLVSAYASLGVQARTERIATGWYPPQGQGGRRR